jgi:nucleoside deoxyribosyltransferase
MNKYKVYIAGPFFNDEERDRMIRLKKYLSGKAFQKDFEFFFPMDSVVAKADQLPNPEWAKKVFESDKDELLKADAVIAIYDKHYSDSGTAWELGYAYGLNIPVKLLCTDLNSDNSLMTMCAADEIFDFEGFLKGAAAIDFKNLNNLK